MLATGSLTRFVVGRGASAMATLFSVSIVIFAAIRLIPGKFEEILVPRGTPEFRLQVAEKLGLNHSLFEQYVKWIGGLFRGDFGLSLLTGRPVWEEFSSRIPVTAEIGLLAMLVAIAVGVPLGLFASLGRHAPGVATASRLFNGLTLSVPDFVLGSMLLYLFSRFPLGPTVGSWISFSSDPVGHVRAVVAPVLTLSFFGVGIVASTSRHSALTVLREDYLTASVLRGASWPQVIHRHILRNACIPVVTTAAIFLGYLLGGTVLIEQLFSVPGFGRYLFQGIYNRDYVVVQAGVMLAATFFILLNMLTDLTYAILDPRLRMEQGR
jgi:peptide/nickel transport system permease protein